MARDTSSCTIAWCKSQGGASRTLCGHCTAHRWCVSCGKDAEVKHGSRMRWANRNGGRCGECVANGRTDRPFADTPPSVVATLVEIEAKLEAWMRAGATMDDRAVVSTPGKTGGWVVTLRDHSFIIVRMWAGFGPTFHEAAYKALQTFQRDKAVTP